MKQKNLLSDNLINTQKKSIIITDEIKNNITSFKKILDKNWSESQLQRDFKYPILKNTLGYPIELIQAETRTPQGKILDFAFTHPETEKIEYFIETKGPNEDPEQHIDQVRSYFAETKVNYATLTNFHDWFLLNRKRGLSYQYFDFDSIFNDKNEIIEDKLKEFIAIFGYNTVKNRFKYQPHTNELVSNDEFTTNFNRIVRQIINNYPAANRIEKVYYPLNILMLMYGSGREIFSKNLTQDLLLYTFNSKKDELDKNTQFFAHTIEHILSKFISKSTSNRTNKIFFTINNKKHFVRDINGYTNRWSQKYSFNDLAETKNEKKVSKELLQQYSEVYQKLKIYNTMLDNKIFLHPVILLTIALSTYDFKKDVPVELLGTTMEYLVYNQHESGSYYTPEWVTEQISVRTLITAITGLNEPDKTLDFILEHHDLTQNEIINLNKKLQTRPTAIIAQKKLNTEILKRCETLKNKCSNLKNTLNNLTILDPACGSGAFLIKIASNIEQLYEKIYEYKKQINNIINKIEKKSVIQLTEFFDKEKAFRQIILNNIYGIDINNEAVETTKSSLCLQLLGANYKLDNLNNTIKCTDSITSDWAKLFPQSQGKFHIIIGNPPYLGNYKLSNEQRNYQNIFPELINRWDLFFPFIIKSEKHLNKDGILSFIVSETISQTDAAKHIINKVLLKNKILWINWYPDINIFDGINIKNISFSIQKTTNITDSYIKIISQNKQLNNFNTDKIKNVFKLYTNTINTKNCIPLQNICFMSTGMKLASKPKKKNETIDEYNKRKFKTKDLISKNITDDFTIPIYTKKTLNDNWYPNTIEYFTNKKDILTKISRPKFPELFKAQPKILTSKIIKSYGIKSLIDNNSYIANNNWYIIVKWNQLSKISNNQIKRKLKQIQLTRNELNNISNTFDHKYLLGLLNSNVIKYYITIQLQNQKSAIKKSIIEKIPIYNATKKEQEKIIKIVDEIIDNIKKNKTYNKAENKLNKEIYKLYKVSQDEIIQIEKLLSKKDE